MIKYFLFILAMALLAWVNPQLSIVARAQQVQLKSGANKPPAKQVNGAASKQASAPKPPSSPKPSRLKISDAPAQKQKYSEAEMREYFSQFKDGEMVSIQIDSGINNMKAAPIQNPEAGKNYIGGVCYIPLTRTEQVTPKNKEGKGQKIDVKGAPVIFSLEKKLGESRYVIFLSKAAASRGTALECPAPARLVVEKEELYRVMRTAEDDLEKAEMAEAKANQRFVSDTLNAVSGLLNKQMQKRDPAAAAQAADAYNKAVVNTNAARKKASGYTEEIGTATHVFRPGEKNTNAN